MAQIPALTSTNLITRTISYVDGANATGAENTDRRARLLQYLQERVIEMWLKREWPWTMRTATLAAPSAAGVTSLPANFYDVGKSGGLVDTDTQKHFISVDLQEMYRFLASADGSSKRYFYALGHGTDGTATRALLVPKGWSGVATLSLYYRRIPPLCVDGAGDELVEIPITHTWNVLIPAMRWMALDDVGDARFAVWHERHEAALKTMCADERAGPQKDTAVVPRIFSPVRNRW